MKRYMSFEEIKKYANEMQKLKVRCKCGHKVFMRFDKSCAICNWCGRKVYKDDKAEFKDKLKKLIKQEEI